MDPSFVAQGLMLFDRIFTIAPEALGLFSFKEATGDDYKKKLGKHGAGVFKTIDKAFKNWGTEAGTKELQELGTRHIDYNVVAAHFAVVGQALIEILGEALGAEFTAELKGIWVTAYGILGAAMKNGNEKL